MKFFSLYKVSIVIVFIAYVYFAYAGMMSFGGLSSGINFTYSVTAIFFVFIALLLLKERSRPNGMKTRWMVVIVWTLLCGFVGLSPTGPAMLHIMFAPLSFLLFYKICSSSNEFNLCNILAVILFILISVFYIQILFLNQSFIVGEIKRQSNLIYWPLSLMPFIFLLKNRKVSIGLIFLLSVFSLLSLKRGALIVMGIAILIYLKKFFFKSSLANRILFVAVIFVLTFLISNYLESYTSTAFDRIDSMRTDQGSGRVGIWESIFERLQTSNILEIVFGHGEGSLVKISGISGHNDFLQILFQYGIIGAFIYLSVFFFCIKRYFYLKKFKSNFSDSYLSSLTVFVVLGTVSELWVSYTYFVFVTAYWGCIEGKLTYDRLHARL